MNHELKQRLIGAVVVTALAAIFIPMLFDDPIDNSGQVVSELAIPATPATVVEPAANKLPANAKQVLKTTETPDDQAGAEDDTDQTTDNPAQHAEEPNAEDLVDVDEGQVLADNKKPLAESPDAGEQPVDDADAAVDDLDTGVVEGEKKHSKKSKSSTAESSEDSVPVKKAKTTIEKPISSAKSSPSAELEKISSAEIKPKASIPKAAEDEPSEDLAVKSSPAPTKPKSSPVKSDTVTKTSDAGNTNVAAKPGTAAKEGAATGKPEFQRWYISVGSFSQRENAFTLYDNLRKQGLAVIMDTIKVAEKGELYRLKIGPELDKKRANAIREKLDKQNISTFLIGEP